MSKWFCSDQHFSHRNVIDYCNRPFVSIDEMNPKLIELHNSVVGKNDIVYFIGDFSLNTKWVEIILPQLNGAEKILVMGNHDGCFPVKGREIKASNQRKRYYLAGFNEIHLHHQLKLSNQQNVLLSHLPYPNKDSLAYDKRYIDYRPEDKGMTLIHGHLHGRYIKSGNMIDVGIDAHDLKPISEEQLIAIIKDDREFIPSKLTEFYKSKSQQDNMKG